MGVKKSNGKNYRSAITGRYVTTNYGKSHPKTTVSERISRTGKKTSK